MGTDQTDIVKTINERNLIAFGKLIAIERKHIGN